MLIAGIVITALGGTVVVLGVALGKSRAKVKEKDHIIKAWGDKTF